MMNDVFLCHQLFFLFFSCVETRAFFVIWIEGQAVTFHVELC